jgi:ATP-dependent helicase HrpB
MLAPLPISPIIPEIVESLRLGNCAIVSAPPGSGKTTRVPPALLDSVKGKVLLLQPRRVAARSSAERIAYERGCKIGEEVGYRVRFESKSGPNTRLEVLTEGLLMRMMQSDPTLEGIDAVVLDEFHERSLHSDMALAMLSEIQREIREDLKIVVMSATLDAEPIQRFLGGPERCPRFEATGRAFDVEVIYTTLQDLRPIEERVVAAVLSELKQADSGHILVFLPGAGEIERCITSLTNRVADDIEVLPLHGRLTSKAQDRAIAPSNKQKVILATNVAETSITIDGVTCVIDSGLARRAKFDPKIGLSRLELCQTSKASTTQRAGRAGRTAAGRCRRLWTKPEQEFRDKFDTPEVANSDLCDAVLQLYNWGTPPSDFQWFEAPLEATVSSTTTLLIMLGALSNQRKITPLGKALSKLPIHPRLGRTIVEGRRLGVLHEAATMAAIASERDPWGGKRHGGVDLSTRVAWVDSKENTGADRRALIQIKRVRDQLLRVSRSMGKLELTDTSPLIGNSPHIALLNTLIAGFPDRVGARRSPESKNVHLSCGRGIQLGRDVKVGELMVAVVITAAERGRPPTCRVAAPLERGMFSADWQHELYFDREREAVFGRRVRRFGEIIIEEKPPTERADATEVARELEFAATEQFRSVFPLTGPETELFRRLRFTLRAAPDTPMPAWLDNPKCMLPTWCAGKKSFAQLSKIDVHDSLLSDLDWRTREALKKVAPTTYPLPNGRHAKLSYPDNSPPTLSAKIQHLFGVNETPKVGGELVMVHLLAPNRRPAQVTQDLKNFWKNTYSQVRKELRGRYPKHDWPEDPTGFLESS